MFENAIFRPVDVFAESHRSLLGQDWDVGSGLLMTTMPGQAWGCPCHPVFFSSYMLQTYYVPKYVVKCSVVHVQCTSVIQHSTAEHRRPWQSVLAIPGTKYVLTSSQIIRSIVYGGILQEMCQCCQVRKSDARSEAAAFKVFDDMCEPLQVGKFNKSQYVRKL